MHISLDLSLLRHWHHKYFVLFYSLSHWCDSIVSLLIWYHHQLIKHAGTRYSFVEDKPQKASGQFGIHRRPQSKVFFYSIHRMSMCNQWMVSCIYTNFSRLTLYILSWSRSTMHCPFLQNGGMNRRSHSPWKAWASSPDIHVCFTRPALNIA